VQDRAELEVNFTKGLPASLSSRITFQTHDFFTPQPVKGADVYFLKHICHDWADPLSISILRQIVPAMTPWANRKGEGSRLIIVDSVMPEIGELPGSLMRLNTAMDLQMMATLNAKERTRKDWEKLLKEADSRFRVVELRKSFGAADSALEVVLDA
jgi:6-hydroxytryprostatin B O-methyltransferase